MHKFVRNLLTEWRKLNLPFAGETFLIALSGGADSVSLVLAINDLRNRKKFANRFVAAHFNHNLRGEESERDAEFVKSLCAKLDFELVLKQGHIEKNGNLEQNARLGRYEFLIGAAERLDARGVLAAHTVNDQAETFLINLIRGSGLRGLSGMKAVISDFKLQITNSEEKSRNNDSVIEHDDPNFKLEDSPAQTPNQISESTEKSEIRNPKSEIELLRPLLNWARREDTENFCRELGVEYRSDTMNEDLAFRRVRIRKVLLPLLEDFNPKIIETLAQTARVLGNELEFVEEIKKREPKSENRKPKTENITLALKDLKNLPQPFLYVVLRDWLEANRGDLRRLDSKHIEAIERLIVSRKSGRSIELPAGETIEKKDGRLIFRRKTLK